MTDNDRYAILIGVSTYDSDAYHDLPAVRADLHYLQAVLENTEIGMYKDCAMVPEPTRAEMLHAIETFLDVRQPNETALLYFSGHGEYCEDDNQLYFLTRGTDTREVSPSPAAAAGGSGAARRAVPDVGCVGEFARLPLPGARARLRRHDQPLVSAAARP